MKINPLYEYKEVSRVTNDDGSRFYTCPETGAPLPSVTTILSATADKTSLILWEQAVGKAKADRVRAEACNLGTLMHTNLENHIQGLPHQPGGHPLRLQAARMADVIIEKGLPKVNEVWGMEVVTYLAGLYAGTTDLVGLHQGQPAIMDYKTAKKLKNIEMIEGYCCQACAYILAHNEVHGTDIKKAVIFMVDRQLQYREFVLEGSVLMDYRDRWLRYLDIFFAPPKLASCSPIEAALAQQP